MKGVKVAERIALAGNADEADAVFCGELDFAIGQCFGMELRIAVLAVIDVVECEILAVAEKGGGVGCPVGHGVLPRAEHAAAVGGWGVAKGEHAVQVVKSARHNAATIGRVWKSECVAEFMANRADGGGGHAPVVAAAGAVIVDFSRIDWRGVRKCAESVGEVVGPGEHAAAAEKTKTAASERRVGKDFLFYRIEIRVSSDDDILGARCGEAAAFGQSVHFPPPLLIVHSEVMFFRVFVLQDVDDDLLAVIQFQIESASAKALLVHPFGGEALKKEHGGAKFFAEILGVVFERGLVMGFTGIIDRIDAAHDKMVGLRFKEEVELRFLIAALDEKFVSSHCQMGQADEPPALGDAFDGRA